MRATLPQAFATDQLMDDFVAFSQRWPQLELEIIAESAIAESAIAEVAVRIMPYGVAPDGHLLDGTVW